MFGFKKPCQEIHMTHVPPTSPPPSQPGSPVEPALGPSVDPVLARVDQLIERFETIDVPEDPDEAVKLGQIVGELSALTRTSVALAAEYRRQIARLDARIERLEKQLA